MKNIDLRIGNYVMDSDTDRVGHVVFFSKKKVGVKMEHSTLWQDIDEFEPIPLSEELLLKCGFEKTHYGYKYHGGNILEFVLKNNEIYLGYFDDDDWCRIGKSIKYIHQLQNLYYALTCEELEVSI